MSSYRAVLLLLESLSIILCYYAFARRAAQGKLSKHLCFFLECFSHIAQTHAFATEMVNYHSLMELLIIPQSARVSYNENELQRFWHFSSPRIFCARTRALLCMQTIFFGASIISLIYRFAANWIWNMKHPFKSNYWPLIMLNIVGNFKLNEN